MSTVTNKGQSTNGAYPSAAKLATIHRHGNLGEAIKKLSNAFHEKGIEIGGYRQDGQDAAVGRRAHDAWAGEEGLGTTIQYDVESVERKGGPSRSRQPTSGGQPSVQESPQTPISRKLLSKS